MAHENNKSLAVNLDPSAIVDEQSLYQTHLSGYVSTVKDMERKF